ncbi:MAG: patatin-like protein, partial [Inhella sp.]
MHKWGCAMAEASYTSELRFGVVMYGGVSLAIYINGVANELFEACCASPKDGSVAAGSGSRLVYRKLSWLLANPGLRALARRYAKGEGDDPFDREGRPLDPAFASERQRFVVDVIAGTSAGGINGVFLAKALANGQPFAPLQQLWVDEGDIALLLNDARSVQKLPLKKPTQPASLLNSDRMYLKLLSAMEDMEKATPAFAGAPGPAARSPLADEIDLFVTTTDIEGAVVPLRLFDKVVHERRHRQVFRFRYAEPQDAAAPVKSDFRAADSPFLAFAARCTSSFPFAFEPMTLKDAERVCALRGTKQDFAQRKRFFKGLGETDLAGDGWMGRPFGDGGYLDNKPFTHAVEALSKRQAVLPIERKLIYVEPAPAHPENEARADGKPHALANALAALTSIPQYETIREDLQAVLKRNRRIERVERMVRMVESDVESHPDDPFARLLLKEGQVPNWSTLDLGSMLDYYGAAFLPYRRLRLNTVSDELARYLAQRWGVDPDSDLQYALRALVRAWREERYYDHADQRTATQNASVNAFLSEFDRSYRRRRAAFLMRKTQQLLRMLPRWAGLIDGSEAPGEGESALLKRLRRHGGDVLPLDAGRLQAALLALRQGLAQTLRSLREHMVLQPAPELERRQLDALLRLLLGEALPLASLPGVDGEPVNILLEAIRPPSSTRTLQQNVFDRALDLFKLARAGRRTQLQTLLEADLETLRLVGSESAAAQGLALLRDLLGRPELKAELQFETLADGSQRETSRVVVVVEPVDEALPWAAVL